MRAIYIQELIKLNFVTTILYVYIVYTVSHKMDPRVENGGNKKFLYYFEIFAIVFELEKEMSKPIYD